jgi:hypothetical protein
MARTEKMEFLAQRELLVLLELREPQVLPDL